MEELQPSMSPEFFCTRVVVHLKYSRRFEPVIAVLNYQERLHRETVKKKKKFKLGNNLKN